MRVVPWIFGDEDARATLDRVDDAEVVAHLDRLRVRARTFDERFDRAAGEDVVDVAETETVEAAARALRCTRAGDAHTVGRDEVEVGWVRWIPRAVFWTEEGRASSGAACSEREGCGVAGWSSSAECEVAAFRCEVRTLHLNLDAVRRAVEKARALSWVARVLLRADVDEEAVRATV